MLFQYLYEFAFVHILRRTYYLRRHLAELTALRQEHSNYILLIIMLKIIIYLYAFHGFPGYPLCGFQHPNHEVNALVK